MSVTGSSAALLFVTTVGTISLAIAAAPDPFTTAAEIAQSPAASVARAGSNPPCDVAGLPSAPLSLSAVVERALCDNPQTREAWANARLQTAQLGISRSADLPTLSAIGAISRNDATGRGAQIGNVTSYSQQSLGLSLRYLLYDFGARSASIDNARQVLLAANAAQDTAIQTVFLAAVQAYYQTFAAQSAVQAAVEAEKAAQEGLEAATVRYEVGAGTPADKLQARTAHSQAALNRIQAEGAAKTAAGVLANVMGLDANLPVNIVAPAASAPDENFEQDVARLIDEARRNRPDLMAAEAQLKAAQANVTAVQASGKPTLSVSADLNYSDTTVSDPFRSSVLGLTLNFPLFTGYNTTYGIRSAQAQVAASMAQRDLLSHQIALDVWKAYQALITETHTLKSSADLVASATESERVALGRYKAGAGNILDLLTAQSALASARQQNVQALYGWYIAKATLAQAMGQLDLAAVAAPAAHLDNK